MSLVGILTGSVELLAENTDGLPEYRERAAGLAVSYRAPSKYFDDIALNLVNNANSIKSSAQSLGGNTGLNTTCYTTDTSYITSTYGDLVASVAIAPGDSLGIAGIGTVEVAYGVIKNDVIEAFNYPKVETLDVTDDNPFAGEGYTTVTAGNSGIGKNSRYTQNGGSTIGNVFALSSAAIPLGGGTCPGSTVASSVSPLKTQYTNAISGISSYTNLATRVKKYKTEYQFHTWSYDRKIKENGDDSTDQTEVSTILSDPTYGGPY